MAIKCKNTKRAVQIACNYMTCGVFSASAVACFVTYVINTQKAAVWGAVIGLSLITTCGIFGGYEVTKGVVKDMCQEDTEHNNVYNLA